MTATGSPVIEEARNMSSFDKMRSAAAKSANDTGSIGTGTPADYHHYEA